MLFSAPALRASGTVVSEIGTDSRYAGAGRGRITKHLAASGDLFPGANGYPTPGVLETDDFVRFKTWGFVTLKVRIVAVEEKAFQSVGLEHDRIGRSFSP